MRIDSPHIYVALMLLSGLALAALQMRHPALAEASVPGFAWLILASLSWDVGLMLLGPRAGLTPLAPAARIVGFLAGAALFFALTAARGP